MRGPWPSIAALLGCLLGVGCAGALAVADMATSADFSVPATAAPGSRVPGEGARRVFRGTTVEVEAAIAAEWAKTPELSVRREGGALVAEQKGSGFSMTMSARFAPAAQADSTEVELLISLSYRLDLERLREMEQKHLEKLAADTGR